MPLGAARTADWAAHAWSEGGGPALIAALAQRQRAVEEREQARRERGATAPARTPALRRLWLADGLAARQAAGGGPIDTGGLTIAQLLQKHFPKRAAPPDEVQRALNQLRWPFWKLLLERRCTRQQLGGMVARLQMLCRGGG